MASPKVSTPASFSPENRIYSGNLIESLVSIVRSAEKKIQPAADDDDILLEIRERASAPLSIDEVLKTIAKGGR